MKLKPDEEIRLKKQLMELEQAISDKAVANALATNNYPTNLALSQKTVAWASIALSILIDYPQILRPPNRKEMIEEVTEALLEVNTATCP